MADYQFVYTEEDSEFLEQRILMKETMKYPEWGQDY
jgi:hypothetical protein